MSNEDQRAATRLSVDLSSQLIAAALAILAIEGAYVAYALSERATAAAFVPVAAVAAVCLAASVFLAGKAITATRNAGFTGSWSLSAGKQLYNWQAILLLLGIPSFGVALTQSGGPKSSESSGADRQRTLKDLRKELDLLADRHEAVSDSFRLLRLKVESLAGQSTGLRAPESSPQ